MMQEQDIIHHQVEDQDHLHMDEISSPMSGPYFDFNDPDLFGDNLQNSEDTSSPNCCYEENSSYVIPQEFENLNTYPDNNGMTNNSNPTTTTTSTTTTTTTTNDNNNTNLSIIFDSPDEIDNDISASIDFSSSPPFLNNDQFDLNMLQPQITLDNNVVVDGVSGYNADPTLPFMGSLLPSVFEEDCFSSIPSYGPLNPSFPHSMATFMPGGAMTADSPTFNFPGNFLLGSELQTHELDYQDSVQPVFNPSDLQVLTSESQQLGAVAATSTPLTSEISSLEDPNFNKVGKLSSEQRKEKIHRYMKKRNERNFSKKIKYACRKTLADSRPRVRGRFAKNDDFGESARRVSNHHEEEEEEEVVVKEEEEHMVDSSDIFAHISGVNSFKCNYPIQSWI